MYGSHSVPVQDPIPEPYSIDIGEDGVQDLREFNGPKDREEDREKGNKSRCETGFSESSLNIKPIPRRRVRGINKEARPWRVSPDDTPVCVMVVDCVVVVMVIWVERRHGRGEAEPRRKSEYSWFRMKAEGQYVEEAKGYILW